MFYVREKDTNRAVPVYGVNQTEEGTLQFLLWDEWFNCWIWIGAEKYVPVMPWGKEKE